MFRYHAWDDCIYLHEWLMFMVNVGKYTIHGWCGVAILVVFGSKQKSLKKTYQLVELQERSSDVPMKHLYKGKCPFLENPNLLSKLCRFPTGKFWFWNIVWRESSWSNGKFSHTKGRLWTFLISPQVFGIFCQIRSRSPAFPKLNLLDAGLILEN